MAKKNEEPVKESGDTAQENIVQQEVDYNKATAALAANAAALAEKGLELYENKKACLLKEAEILGIKPSKFTFTGTKLKDLDAEQKKHEMLSLVRLEYRIKKAKAAKSVIEQRKTMLLARIQHSQDYPVEQIAQAKFELRMMEMGKWKKGIRMPKQKGIVEEILG